MRSEAYKLSGFTVIISALGFLLRWLQDMRIASEDGLTDGALISWLVACLMVVTAVLLTVLIFHLKQFDAPSQPDKALAGQTPFYGIICMVPAIVLAAAGLLQAVKPGDVLWPTLHRACGVAAILGAFGIGVLAANSTKPEGASASRKGMALLMLFMGLWLVTGYRDAATDPIVWRFVVGILARCVALLAIYYTAGYFFNAPHPWWTLLTCDLGAFLCVMCAIDEGSMAQSVMYAAMAMQLLIWGFVVVENLKTKPLTAQSEE